jgi:hypothetical protein
MKEEILIGVEATQENTHMSEVGARKRKECNI